MTIETFRLYQTLAESGVPYPTEPAAPDIDTKIMNAPNVYYVKELVNPEYDESLDEPTITADDTGKRFNMYVVSGGPVLGDYAATNGVTRAYIPEDAYLWGWWYNGQLFGVPITKGDASIYDSQNPPSGPLDAGGEYTDPVPCVPANLPTSWDLTVTNGVLTIPPYLFDGTFSLTSNGEVLPGAYEYRWQQFSGPDLVRQYTITQFCETTLGDSLILFDYVYVFSGVRQRFSQSLNNVPAGTTNYEFYNDPNFGTTVVGVKVT